MTDFSICHSNLGACIRNNAPSGRRVSESSLGRPPSGAALIQDGRTAGFAYYVDSREIVKPVVGLISAGRRDQVAGSPEGWVGIAAGENLKLAGKPRLAAQYEDLLKVRIVAWTCRSSGCWERGKCPVSSHSRSWFWTATSDSQSCRSPIIVHFAFPDLFKSP